MKKMITFKVDVTVNLNEHTNQEDLEQVITAEINRGNFVYEIVEELTAPDVEPIPDVDQQGPER